MFRFQRAGSGVKDKHITKVTKLLEQGYTKCKYSKGIKMSQRVFIRKTGVNTRMHMVYHKFQAWYVALNNNL